MKAYKIIINGDVQGVFYRHFAKKEAKKLKISGWIKNNQDGSVEAYIQGDDGQIEQFIDWAHRGSPMATVRNVKVTTLEEEIKFSSFEIK